MEDTRIQWWKPGPLTENFGDFLTVILRDTLFDGAGVEASIYHLIGSVIDEARIGRELASVGNGPDARILFWGCGCRTEQRLSAATMARSIFCGVRGPLSREVLGLPATTPLGDPALLLPLIYRPRPSSRTQGRLVCIPHVNDRIDYGQLAARTGADLVISPGLQPSRQQLEEMIDDICAARFVLAGALHAAIIAGAYGVPFCYMDTGHLDIPFKWRDFSASVNIGSYFTDNVRDGQAVYSAAIAPNLRRPPLAGILGVAPFRVKPHWLAAARDHVWAGPPETEPRP